MEPPHEQSVKTDHPVISREEAKAAGLKRYFTGLPCKHGHVYERRVYDWGCILCCRAAKHRSYRKNKERNRPATRIRERKRYRKLTETQREQHRKWARQDYAKHRERRLRQTAEHRAAHKDVYKLRQKEWRKANAEYLKTKCRNRRALIRAAEGAHTLKDIERLYLLQKKRCALCAIPLRKRYHVDHIMPLARGGTNAANNLQITCATCNHRKKDKDPIDFSRQNGRLL